MEITNLEEELNSGRNEFVGEIIQISGNGIFIDENSLVFITSLSFQDCIFKGTHLEFENINMPEFYLGFFNCSFEISLDIKNCNLKRLGFRDIKSNKSIYISEGHYSNFFFRNNNLNEKRENQLSNNLSICNLTIDEKIKLDYINHTNGEFDFSNNTLSNLKSEYKDKIITFENSTFNNAKFRETSFFEETSFEKMEITESCFFEECEFQKVNFSHSDFSSLTFNNCDFLNTTWFENCKNLKESKITFIACKFEKYSLFDNSKFNKIEILHSKFQEKASFENLETNYFKIHQVTFAEAAYFDDLNKNNNKAIENWDRKTLRAIKRELINTHNQIDYLRFKAYELNAFDKEKGKNYKDQIVLFFNKHSNYFGLDWTKGLWFIFISSFTFYLLYLITFIIAIEITLFLPKTFEDFLVIYIRFLNPFSFLKPPIVEAEEYFFPLLILNLSKIFVSYGIYQTIQAFRKFGVNGG